MRTKAEVLQASHWDEQYESQVSPWETGQPSSELQRTVAEHSVRPGRAVEFGCGTGASAIWLAAHGFAVTAVDLSPVALRRARRRAARAGVGVRFVEGNLIDVVLPGGPFDFFFDGGCYQAVRLADPAGYLGTLRRVTRPGAVGLVLTGNAAEPEDKAGPPVLEEKQVREEFAPTFEVVRLRPFRFDAREGQKRYLGWSCFLKRH